MKDINGNNIEFDLDKIIILPDVEVKRKIKEIKLLPARMPANHNLTGVMPFITVDPIKMFQIWLENTGNVDPKDGEIIKYLDGDYDGEDDLERISRRRW